MGYPRRRDHFPSLPAVPPRWSCPCPSFPPPKRSRRGDRRSPTPEKAPVPRRRTRGCGIPEEYQRSIFHPFFRVDKSRSREYGGAGLGLSLVWEIANLHGGSVWVEESSEKGTVIAVELAAQ